MTANSPYREDADSPAAGPGLLLRDAIERLGNSVAGCVIVGSSRLPDGSTSDRMMIYVAGRQLVADVRFAPPPDDAAGGAGQRPAAQAG